jgi:hypothetical protein
MAQFAPCPPTETKEWIREDLGRSRRDGDIKSPDEQAKSFVSQSGTIPSAKWDVLFPSRIWMIRDASGLQRQRCDPSS